MSVKIQEPTAGVLLVVDDIEANRTLLRRRFERLGYGVVEADRGARALEIIEGGGIDLVLLDLVMPEIDGLEVLRHVRQSHSPEAMPVIVVTAKATSEDVVEALELGANDYLTKPVDLSVAKARVAAQIGRKRAEERNQQIQAQLHAIVARLEEALQRADVAAAAKSEFLANMRHELKTPLNGVVRLSVLLAGACANPKDHASLLAIKDSAAALDQLLSDILDAAQIGAHGVVLKSSAFDPAEVLRDVADLFGPTAISKSLSLEVRSEAPSRAQAVGDAGRLRQILTNLVGNAVKFTQEGGVVCTLRASGDSYEFEVRDTGIGFNPAAAPALFERFRQADEPSTRQFGDMSLGLTLSHELAELMGGSLEADSVIGKGSVFRLRLPLVAHGGAGQSAA